MKLSDIYFWIYMVLGLIGIFSIFFNYETKIIVIRILHAQEILLCLFGYIIINRQEQEIKDLNKKIKQLENERHQK